jgi:4a-hydroxytetrahydrobiopterin dehydratase
MGFCMSFSRRAAEDMLQTVKGWELVESPKDVLRIKRHLRTKNFMKALELCSRVAEVAEAEGHHPDLHLTGWNNLTLELWTHARNGLTENDLIMAAKINSIPMDDLLSKRKPKPASV